MKALLIKIIILWCLFKGSFGDKTIRFILRNLTKCNNDTVSRFFLYLRFHGGVTAIDIDGVLCEEKGHYEARTKKHFEQKENNKYIVLFTARLSCDRALTLKWLRNNGIKFDGLITNKLPYDILIDDKTKNYG